MKYIEFSFIQPLFLKINKKYCGLDIRVLDVNYGRE